MSSKIRICTQDDALVLAEIVQKSFQDVAERFGLTQENAPRHPSNCTMDWIRNEMKRGVTYFVIENKNHIVGCVALEQANTEVCYLERLAVLPDQRRRGFGKALVEHVLSEAKLLGVNYVSVGIIAEQTELKNWYRRLGFVEGESKEFPHLPFRVTFMSYGIKKGYQQYAPVDGAGPCQLNETLDQNIIA
ncbi:MAG: GNAT family N-acetyltransferase [Dehalococcoidia bacterium]|jgi:N-acetylglutamate synthase-like GNAT family acetyltransferase